MRRVLDGSQWGIKVHCVHCLTEWIVNKEDVEVLVGTFLYGTFASEFFIRCDKCEKITYITEYMPSYLIAYANEKLQQEFPNKKNKDYFRLCGAEHDIR